MCIVVGDKMRAKCDQCGECCRSEVCEIGLAVVGDGLPCRALELHDDGKHYCGLVLHASRYVDVGDENVDWKDEYLGKLFSEKLGIGKGCCSDFKE